MPRINAKLWSYHFEFEELKAKEFEFEELKAKDFGFEELLTQDFGLKSSRSLLGPSYSIVRVQGPGFSIKQSRFSIVRVQGPGFESSKHWLLFFT
jgi:hypothetical protein